MNIILEKAPEILDIPGNRCYFPVGIFPKTSTIEQVDGMLFIACGRKQLDSRFRGNDAEFFTESL